MKHANSDRSLNRLVGMEDAVALIEKHIKAISTTGTIPFYHKSDVTVYELLEGLNAAKIIINEKIHIDFGCGGFGVSVNDKPYSAVLRYFTDFYIYITSRGSRCKKNTSHTVKLISDMLVAGRLVNIPDEETKPQKLDEYVDVSTGRRSTVIVLGIYD